ncbi:MAG: 4-hydroxy-tetrahydrodipicolinate reductase [Caulobacterales bacterium]|nr:4-hydroxy-tetrahydrodipicolinate reductase [Caulobacterales bacterium]
MTETVAIAVAGPAGRLGSAILKAAHERSDMRLVAGLARPGSGAAGMDLGRFTNLPDVGVSAVDDLEAAVGEADVLIDVSTAHAAAEHAHALAQRGGPALIVGATGFEPEEEEALAAASAHIPVVKAQNFSLGVTLLVELSRIAAARLGEEWDIEIMEMHHRAKADAPSGTALLIGRAVADGRGVDFEESTIPPRAGMTGPRERGRIGFASLRGGGVVGDHEVMFAAPDGMITLAHRAHDRRIFATGALKAATWIKGRAPGLYSMRDVLGFAAEG